MTPLSTPGATIPRGSHVDYDAIVIGAGFGGIYMLHKLRNELGLTVRAYDRASGVGGTWHWNRYPGALSDTEGFVYRYSFDRELLQDYDWSTRYLKQTDILAYLEHVVDRFDLARDIQLDTGITAAVFDEDTNSWTVTTDRGETVTATYVVTALGLLSKINMPDIPGIDTFAGEIIHTGAWPEEHDLRGKRVGVIGNGSTGQQVISAIAPEAEHLTVFMRTPQYSVPAGDRAMSPEEVSAIKRDYDSIWDQVRNSVVAFGFEESTVPAMSVSEEERQRVFQENWDIGGGFRFMFGTFCDIATDPAANEAAASFIRSKISEIVEDPEKARILTPTDLYARRPLCANHYYETFNRDNVSVADIKAHPIVEITPDGLRTADGRTHELDVLVLATGFDAVDGNYLAMDLRGRGGRSINEAWAEGPASYLGTSTAGFPNLFMILGPNGPFTNLPPSIETQVEWIGTLVAEAQERGTAVEASTEAERAWTETCRTIADMTLFPRVDSWIFGANIPGKTQTVMFYMGGLANYRAQLAEVADDGFRGFEFTEVPVEAAA
ncbi:flavin-containing monooxygenase [Geodermatophilus sabuli]|uniref:Predicted flavoprotein CzcO associated with the cation diffusion facilitator CzcD n=1 Tax=Geodermatophilus sabuli TaxID=1564158 RepID=A0A285E6E1_9ACTN|nr:NAD(P)/FAD-dependent oxidoreductase [Geodermatophilus sabuli]MBB3082478.1 cation diffusion facilitator CzcD-associated flavoprotein CzcO [Geodermatophilus sabuli]SNX94652.1 Predicted flavoprotein CzcO associated with the cation diffusion facilitator CzcD [Geodermatophilus sabuli]